MQTVEEIKTAIKTLPKDDYVVLRNWFSERDWDSWDRKITKDSAQGKLDFLINEAMKEKEKGELSLL
jgi:hypothetical protein